MGQSQPNARPPHLLVDASIYIFQYYFSLPDHWFSEEGYPTGAVYGYSTFLLRLLEAERPERIAVCFDESLGSCFRNRIYPHYKASRAHPDEALAFQLRACRKVTEHLGIACFASPEYEADDLLATLGRRLRRGARPVAVLSRDKDLGQLLFREQDFLWDYAKGERFYSGCIQRKFGVKPEQLADYLALVGDSIDDIPGVPGLGPRTAGLLLKYHPSIDAIFAARARLGELPIRGAARLADKLVAHREQIEMARRLARIVDTVPLSVRVRDLDWRPGRADLHGLEAFCQAMGFPRLRSRFQRVLARGLCGRAAAEVPA